GDEDRWSAIHDLSCHGTRYSGLALPIGLGAEGGLLAVACSRADFPTETDQLLLSVGANHAATAFQNARLIQERRTAEAQLRQARDQLEMKVAESTVELRRTSSDLQTIFDAAPQGIALLREDLTVQRCNAAFERLLGWPSREIVGYRLPSPGRHDNDWPRLMAQLKPGDGFTTLRLRLGRKNGSEFEASVGCARLVDDQGTPGGFVVNVVDLSQQKRAEDSLRRVQTELAHVTRVTTLGELVASIGHEIRQPLAAIVADASASLACLENGHQDLGMVREALRDVIDNGGRAGDVIHRLRQLVTKHDPQLGPIDINEAIREVIPLVRSEALRQGVLVRAALDPQLPSVNGDRVQLQQVIINLVLNGLEAMTPVPTASREVVILAELRGPDRLRVSVQDSGVGLDPKHVEKIFDAFFTTKPDGMGMGLSISRSIIERHGGRLWAAPNPTKGATFSFELPAVGVDARGEMSAQITQHDT
ncbi:MAG: two-component system sensor histidine kinase NtrB, partial [Gemmatimonadaceae bacterium]